MYHLEYSQTGAQGSFELIRPANQSVPFVFSSPHSGRIYPRSFLKSSTLGPTSIRKSEDFMIDDLFLSAVENGAPLLCAKFARAFLDVNRESHELDPKMFAGKLPSHANTNSLRVAGGLGTVAKIVAERTQIYSGKLSVDEVLERIEVIYQSYHHALRQALSDTFVQFGYCILVDCHSMPSAKDRNRSEERPDFIIGDRYATSSTGEIITIATRILRDMGYRVEINKPYAGGYITQHYGRPKEGVHAMQIEINRGLYMDESTMTASDGYGQLADNLAEFVRQLVILCPMEIDGPFLLAAE